jgi:hypothetical protein
MVVLRARQEGTKMAYREETFGESYQELVDELTAQRTISLDEAAFLRQWSKQWGAV